MKVNFSISLKLTVIVVILSTIIIFSLAGINFHMQNDREKLIDETTKEWAVINFANSHAVLKSLDEELSDYKQFNNTEKIQDDILFIVKNNSEILQININTMFDDEILVNISTDAQAVGTKPNEYNILSYEDGDTYYVVHETEPLLTIISPINISGDIVGTSEIIISMYPTALSNEGQIQLVVIVAFVSILILIFSTLILLRRSIVKPIKKFRDSARIIGKGDLDTKIKISSRDELGELAFAFNQMAKDLKESRDKVEDYNKILENLLDRKDEFIGQLGHDLKNPLQPLIGLLPSLVEKETDPEKKELLQIMSNNAEHMKNLIRDTLELAKLRSETIEFNMESINLKDEAQKATEAQKLLLKENKIIIENKIPNDIIVQADSLRLNEVFTNLITNSVKYTAEDGGKITLDATVEDDTVTVSLQDTGIGMSKEQINKIFDEFYKADKFSSEYSSTGLGLAICKRIVEKMDGRIWVESPGPGQGSTFYFTLKSKAKNN